jgi:uncharacterized protein YjaZ
VTVRRPAHAVAVAFLLALAACSNTRFNAIAPGDAPPGVAEIPNAIDLEASGHLVHLDPTVLLWGRDSDVDLQKTVRHAIERIDGELHASPTQISISAGSYRVIPDVGIGGSTDARTGEVLVSMDSRSPLGLRKLLTVWLPLVLAHELHHSTRVLDGPGYGTTLLDTIVAEGGAEAFVRETYPDAPAIPWVRSLGAATERRLWREAKDHLDEPDDSDVYERWFLGKGDLPRWTGYRLGYAIANAYLDRHRGASAAELATLASRAVLEQSGYDART